MTTDHMELRNACASTGSVLKDIQRWPTVEVDRKLLEKLLAAYDALVAAKPKRKGTAKLGTIPRSELPGWWPLEPWDQWDAFLAMRAKIKKPATERAQKLLISKLVSFASQGMDPGAVLDQSTTNCWQDLYALKDRNGGGRPVRGLPPPEAPAQAAARRARWDLPPADAVEDISHG